MENVILKKNFQTFVKVCHLFSKVLLVAFSVWLSFIVILFGLIGLTPSEKIANILEQGKINVTLSFSGININLSEQVVSNFQFSKQPILALLGLTALYFVMLLVITYCIQAILKSIQKNQIFSKANSKYIEWIAYGFVLMSVTLQPIQTMVVFLFDELFNLSSYIQNSTLIQAISYDFLKIHWSLLFSGVIIWIIGRIFKYGAFLQEEFDATL